MKHSQRSQAPDLPLIVGCCGGIGRLAQLHHPAVALPTAGAVVLPTRRDAYVNLHLALPRPHPDTLHTVAGIWQVGGAQGVLEVGEVTGVGELILPISQDCLPTLLPGVGAGVLRGTGRGIHRPIERRTCQSADGQLEYQAGPVRPH